MRKLIIGSMLSPFCWHYNPNGFHVMIFGINIKVNISIIPFRQWTIKVKYLFVKHKYGWKEYLKYTDKKYGLVK